MSSALIVDGYDLTNLVKFEGYDGERNDLDGPNAGRTMDGYMHRDYVAYKRKVSVQFRPLEQDEWAFIEHMVLRDKVEHNVEFEDFGRMDTMRAYSSSFKGTIYTITGRRIGAGVNFIEV